MNSIESLSYSNSSFGDNIKSLDAEVFDTILRPNLDQHEVESITETTGSPMSLAGQPAYPLPTAPAPAVTLSIPNNHPRIFDSIAHDTSPATNSSRVITHDAFVPAILDESNNECTVPVLYVSRGMESADDLYCILKILDNSGKLYYCHQTRQTLKDYSPPGIADDMPLMILRSGDGSTVDYNTLYGKSLMWACAKYADLLPADRGRDLIVAMDIWERVMDLLKRVYAKRGTEEHTEKNKELRWFILEVRMIESLLCQLATPGEIVATVLGGGRRSFADYAIARLYERLLQDDSEYRLPYTRQKKYPRILEIAENVLSEIPDSHKKGCDISTDECDIEKCHIKRWDQLDLAAAVGVSKNRFGAGVIRFHAPRDSPLTKIIPAVVQCFGGPACEAQHVDSCELFSAYSETLGTFKTLGEFFCHFNLASCDREIDRICIEGMEAICKGQKSIDEIAQPIESALQGAQSNFIACLITTILPISPHLYPNLASCHVSNHPPSSSAAADKRFDGTEVFEDVSIVIFEETKTLFRIHRSLFLTY